MSFNRYLLPVVLSCGLAVHAFAQDLPSWIDNSQSKYFPPIIGQSGGSCAQASSIGYVFTYEINRLLDRDAGASEANRFSYLAAWNLVNDGINQGGFAEDGLFLAMRMGALTEEDYGNTCEHSFKWASGYDKYLTASRYRVEEFLNFPDSVELIKHYLYDACDGSKTGGIVSFSGHCFGWDMDDNYDGPSGSGYHSIVKELPKDGSHAMTIVGYDDLVSYTDSKGVQHTGAFIVANSWGRWCHDNGRYYYPYDFFRDKSIPNSTLSNTFIGAKVKYLEKRAAIKLTLDYSSRDDLAYHVGATRSVTSSTPENYYKYTALSNHGGDYPMQGAYDGSTIEFALDLSDHLSGDDCCRYFLKIVRSAIGKKKGSGEVKALSVIDYTVDPPKEYNYRGTLPATIADGENCYYIGLVPRYETSCSPYRIQDSKTVEIRTANGRNAFVRVEKKNGKRILNYTLKP